MNGDERQSMSQSRTRWWVVLAGGLSCIAVMGVLLDRFYHDPNMLPPDDFLTYWAAGRLATSGGNPYDPEQTFALQKAAGRPNHYASIMWSPPWSLTLVMPFGIPDARTSQLLWILLQVGGVLLAVDYLWRVYGGEPSTRWVAWAVAVSPMMLGTNILAGQASGWLLIGITAFLAAVNGNRPALTVVTALCAHKPHLFVPFWILLILDATRSRSAALRLGWGIAAGVTAIIIAYLVDPAAWEQYFALTANPPANHPRLQDWEPPLIGYWARIGLDAEKFWIQILPTAVVAVMTPLYWWLRRTSWDWPTELPVVILAGLIGSPYGAWPYDLLLLYIPIIAALAHLGHSGHSRMLFWALGGYFVLQSTIHIPITAKWFFWFAPVIAAGYYWVMTIPAKPVPSQMESKAC